MYKVDLHNHSIASPDGGITANQYEHVLTTGVLDCIAITDHNRIDFALKMFQSFGDKIIVGEEIMTTSGEIVGLFLQNNVPANLNLIDTIRLIKNQGGLVYIPHPLETFRHGLQINVLEEIVDLIDIVEIANGRSFFQSKYTKIKVWSNLNHLVGCASSDAHGKYGLGQTYTLVHELPTQSNLVNVLLKSSPIFKKPSIRALLYPKYNRFIKRFD